MSSKPKIKIPVHVFAYSIALLPGTIYAYYWYKNSPTDEEHEAELRKKYAHHIESSKQKHESMTKFLQGMRDPNNTEQQARMAEVLRGGRGSQKRLHAVDESLYGTYEGAKLQKQALEKKRKKGKSKKTKIEEQSSDEDYNGKHKAIKQSVAAVAFVGILAAGASVFLGGKRQ
ncbi:hypothetical protein HJC23_005918 [Cyclotella cryptica]|uniref:Uncharacterized protein n=1 Tax=Cyclotella cryptica TaxID=29204 RepID=A0ABD3QZ86_9STRA|eukprot:CCRYP_000478-RA/>CCRYP_000478-RA protein AED:0.02 eAED:-0.01 QI:0/-1/0/1/-1/1/1/0/172